MQVIANAVRMADAGLEARDPRLTRSAHAFEATLMKELLAPLQQGRSLSQDGAEEGSGGALASFAVESLASVISERGGFGVAERVLHSLENGHGGHGNHEGTSTVPGALSQRA